MYLLIPAAGVGKRMGSDRNKLLLPLLDHAILGWTLLAAEAASSITWIGIMGQPIDFPHFNEILNGLELSTPVTFIEGGATRQQSVFNGLQALPPEAHTVLIHDGARCLATPELFDRCTAAMNSCRAMVVAVPVKDTIKIVNADLVVTSTPDRATLYAAQTPQGFDVDLLKQCHRQGLAQGWEVTDDAALCEKCDFPVKIVPGEETNLKITTPGDLAIAEFIIKQRSLV